jgi:hypothetical protein
MKIGKTDYSYLGDGVYASFDGYGIRLMANGVNESATDNIYLEPEVMEELIRYYQDQVEKL